MNLGRGSVDARGLLWWWRRWWWWWRRCTSFALEFPFHVKDACASGCEECEETLAQIEVTVIAGAIGTLVHNNRGGCLSTVVNIDASEALWAWVATSDFELGSIQCYNKITRLVVLTTCTQTDLVIRSTTRGALAEAHGGCEDKQRGDEGGQKETEHVYDG